MRCVTTLTLIATLAVAAPGIAAERSGQPVPEPMVVEVTVR